MRILQLAPQFPFPSDDGGKIGISNIYYQFLKQGYEVEMICTSRFPIDNEQINKYKKEGNINIVLLDSRNTKLRVLKYFLMNKSMYIEKQYRSNLMQVIESLVDMSTIDIIHADHSNMAKLAIQLSKKYDKPIGLRLHNIEYLIWERFYRGLSKFSPKKLFIGQQFHLLKKLELKFISDSDVAFAITKQDQSLIKKLLPNSNIEVASAGVDVDLWRPDFNCSRVPNSLVIATNFNWFHNVNAVRWFLDRVLPKLREIYPNFQLKIIGKNPPSDFNKYISVGAKNIGYVDDVKPYFNQSKVYIAPLFVGGGIRIKILEAMAMGLPVIATDISAEGIEANNEQGLIRANSEEEYFNQIKILFDNEDLRIELGKKARDFILANHTWKSNVAIIINSYSKLVSSKKNKA